MGCKNDLGPFSYTKLSRINFFFSVMYFILFLGMKENSNLKTRIYRYQNQPLLYKKLQRKAEMIHYSYHKHTNGAQIISEPGGT